MYPIKLCLDQYSFSAKPPDSVVEGISARIGSFPTQINNRTELEGFIKKVSTQGYTFTPATFSDSYRHQESFAQQQFIAMDFDNDEPEKLVTFDEVLSRAKDYDLYPLFAYNSLRSSPEHHKFRMVFLNDVSVPDPRVAKAMQLAMGEIFPEADKLCYTDISKMYFGGKELIYYDKAIPMIDIETLFRNFHHCVKKNYGEKHYKEKIQRFSKETGISLTRKGLLDVSKSDEPDKPAHLTEGPGANSDIKNGGNSPTTIVVYNRIAHGENPPFYYIKFRERGTTSPSVGVGSTESHSDNHNQFRLSSIEKVRHYCRLFRGYESGEEVLNHDELFGLMTSLIGIETGGDLFLSIMSKSPESYDHLKKWRLDVRYCIQQGYKPRQCDRFCPYCEKCSHTRNILTTAHPSRNLMEPDPNYNVDYCSLEEAQNDVYKAIYHAYMQNDDSIYIIKAQVGIGKSHSYLRIMKEHPGERFLIAAPTNLLKNEIYEKAKAMGIDVCVTPSLDEIKDELPAEVWKRIQRFYMRGQFRSVATYIKKVLEKEDIACLKEYVKQKERVRKSKGCLITTHRYMLTMDEERLNEFDTVIVDEDILFKSIFTNQGEITISALGKLKQDTSDPRLRRKIKELLAQAKVRSCIRLDTFEYNIEDDVAISNDKKSIPLDIASFCAASHFYVRKAERERNLKKDTVSFLTIGIKGQEVHYRFCYR